MLVPPMYEPRSPADTVALVRAYPMAVVIGYAQGDLLATHAPVVLEHPEELDKQSATPLHGVTFIGHMNRINEHFALMRSGEEVLLVFQGAHAYISPAYHGRSPAAPTWNFAAVHLRGTLEVIDRGQPTLDVVTATVRQLERAAGTGWDMTDSLSYFEQIVPGVGAFRVQITSVEAMFKLGQEQPSGTRDAICRWLEENPRCMHHRLSEAMRDANQEDGSHAHR